MKHCPKCNLDFPISYKFCGSCGGSLPDSHTCQNCGDVVDSRWGFCTGCGKSLSRNAPNGDAVQPEIAALAEPAVAASVPSRTVNTIAPVQTPSKNGSHREWYEAPDPSEDLTETTLTSSRAANAASDIPRAMLPSESGVKKAPTLTMLSAYGHTEKAAPIDTGGWQKAIVGLLALVFVAALGFGTVYWWTHRASAAAPPPTENVAAPETASAAGPSTTDSKAAPVINKADEEWKRLREKRIAANAADATDVINSLEQAETNYPGDYRFAYERAKLSIKGITSHHEAFEALSSAAAKAMDNGKAQAMLDNLLADQDGDFWKLARGHHEWQAIVEALRSKDKKELPVMHH